MNIVRKLAVVSLLLLFVNVALAQLPIDWTAGGGTNQNWSQSLNWDGPLTSFTPVYFEDQNAFGYTNVQGAVNNIVDTSTNALEAHYTALMPNSANAGSTNANCHYYTTQINPGVTLTLGQGGYAHNVLNAGDIPDNG